MTLIIESNRDSRRAGSTGTHDVRSGAADMAAEVLSGLLGTLENKRSVHETVADRMPNVVGESGLDPCPEVDAALGRLVHVLTTQFEGPSVSSGFHWEVVRSICETVAEDPELQRRALTVRRAAGVAEARMEHHYARLMLETSGSTTPQTREPLRILRQLLHRFPYTQNYETLVAAELAGLSRVRTTQKLVAFCGAGALPLSALLWNMTTGSRVVLVEVDPDVGALAGRVIDQLGQLGVVNRSDLTIQISDAADLDPEPFDVVAVASLVANDTITALAERIAEIGPTGPHLMARSAVGLTAMLAYAPIQLSNVVECGLDHIGTVASALDISDGPDLNGLAVPNGPTLLHRAPIGVLNTCEFFARTS